MWSLLSFKRTLAASLIAGIISVLGVMSIGAPASADSPNLPELNVSYSGKTPSWWTLSVELDATNVTTDTEINGVYVHPDRVGGDAVSGGFTVPAGQVYDLPWHSKMTVLAGGEYCVSYTTTNSEEVRKCVLAIEDPTLDGFETNYILPCGVKSITLSDLVATIFRGRPDLVGGENHKFMYGITYYDADLGAWVTPEVLDPTNASEAFGAGWIPVGETDLLAPLIVKIDPNHPTITITIAASDNAMNLHWETYEYLFTFNIEHETDCPTDPGTDPGTDPDPDPEPKTDPVDPIIKEDIVLTAPTTGFYMAQEEVRAENSTTTVAVMASLVMLITVLLVSRKTARQDEEL